MFRSYALAIAVLALAGCASSGYGGPYDQYPDQVYYEGPHYEGPYNGGYDYDTDYDNNSDRYFRPARGITCDRSRDICYDRNGLSYHATARYLGEREANRAYKHYGDQVFLFSPKPGVTCDLRTQTCSRGNWNDRYFGENGEDGPYRAQQNEGGRAGNQPGLLYKPGVCPPKGCSNK